MHWHVEGHNTPVKQWLHGLHMCLAEMQAEREEAEGSLRTGLGLTRKYGIYRYRQNEQGTLTRSQLVTEGLLALRAKKKAQERIQRHMQPPLESDRQS